MVLLSVITNMPWRWCYGLLSVMTNMNQVLALHQFDCARANKSSCAWGVEARVPFLDADFIEEVMTTSPEDKLIKPVSR